MISNFQTEQVLTVLTYECESWNSTIETDQKLNGFENKCIRRLLNNSWNEFRTNDSIQETKYDYASNYIRKKHCAYIGHILRIKDERLPKTSLHVVTNRLMEERKT